MNEQNIFQRINAVMKAVEYVKKDRKVDTYMAVTYDQLVSVCRSELVKNGIAIFPEQTEGVMLVMRDPKNDVKMHLYSGTYNVNFVNIDKPDDRYTVTVQAHATDNGDKAPGKALTYAVKSAMLKALMLETGENDESRAGPSSGIDTDAILLEIDKIVNVASLAARRKAWYDECHKANDIPAWNEIAAACQVRKGELEAAQ